MKRIIITAALALLMLAPAAPATAQSMPGMRFCFKTLGGYDAFAKRKTTSCAFVRASVKPIKRKQAQQPGGRFRLGQRFRVRVHSPVTDRTYRLRCFVGATRVPATITCRGGNDALIAFIRP
jgi:hypothetical protein